MTTQSGGGEDPTRQRCSTAYGGFPLPRRRTAMRAAASAGGIGTVDHAVIVRERERQHQEHRAGKDLHEVGVADGDGERTYADGAAGGCVTDAFRGFVMFLMLAEAMRLYRIRRACTSGR